VSLTRLFDALFVNQLFQETEAGETVFYPKGKDAQGYRVPAGDTARVKADVRWLVVFSQLGVLVALLVPRLYEEATGVAFRFDIFVVWMLVAAVVIIVLSLNRLSRIAAGLPALPRT